MTNKDDDDVNVQELWENFPGVRGGIFHVGSVPGECLEGHPGFVFRSPCKDYEFLCVAVMTCTILVNTHR